MPIDTAACMKVWYRYSFCRDNGHNAFVEKAELCDRNFSGDQWVETDKSALRLARRPALTINKIISTLSNVLGEQIFTRNEISFRPKKQAMQSVADALTLVAKYVSDNNQLDWKRSDMFADGCITSRGYLDMRMAFDDSMQGDIVIENINPKNVIVDPDAEDYDPDKWNEVFVTKWLTADDIAILYNKEDADYLRNRDQTFFPYGYDSIQSMRDRFGDRFNPMIIGTYDESSVMRAIRVIERQHRLLDRQKHFVFQETGEVRPIPEDFDRNRIAWYVEKFGFGVMTKLVHRIKWTVVADNVLLHDEWSPYKHFTIVPYFPYFRHGRTIGLVENLLGPQELLNKVSSQELHVINTTANSGWKIRAGALVNMAIEELEQRGAETGLVVEVNGDPDKDVVKIQPNNMPQGLDRLSYKAEEHIKTISGVPDSAQGHDREDVAAKAIREKRTAAKTNIVKPLDSLNRTDFILARNMLDLVQEFYTEPRLLNITTDALTGESTELAVNQPHPETGEILNDLTLGEYGVVTTSVPQRDSLEDTQFDQAVELKQLGVQLPDEILIENSRLLRKRDIVKKLAAQAQSPEAQQQRQLQTEGMAAEVRKTSAEADAREADAGLRRAKTLDTTVKARKLANEPPGADLMKAQAEIQLDSQRAENEMALEERKFEHESSIKEREFQLTAMLKEREDRRNAQIEADNAMAERAERVRRAATEKATES